MADVEVKTRVAHLDPVTNEQHDKGEKYTLDREVAIRYQMQGLVEIDEAALHEAELEEAAERGEKSRQESVDRLAHVAPDATPADAPEPTIRRYVLADDTEAPTRDALDAMSRADLDAEAERIGAVVKGTGANNQIVKGDVLGAILTLRGEV